MEGIATTVDLPIDEAEECVRQALVAEGFGVLTDIDVAAVLHQKLGVDRAPLKILGACNPGIAHRALALDPSIALVLPCNVVLEETAPGRTRVAIADPALLVDLSGERPDTEAGQGLRALGREASHMLQEVVRRIGT